MYNVGMVFGKFYPLHNGHVNMINKASSQCDKLYVVLSYREQTITESEDKYGFKPVSLKTQLKWLYYTFKDMNHIIIKYIDESSIPKYPEGCEQWSNLIKEVIGEKIDAIFTADIEYEETFKITFSESKFVLMDPNRDEFPICASLIKKEGIYKYWEFLPAVVRRDFVFKVVIMGVESTGKTTLCKYLSKYFSTAYVGEYGRDYVINELGGNELALTSEDLERIAYGHKIREYEEEKRANKLLIIDSNAGITQLYHYLYEKNNNKLIDTIIKHELYDLILYIRPDKIEDINWVDDGVRRHCSVDDKNFSQNILDLIVNHYYEDSGKVKILNGNYYENFIKAVDIIKIKMTKGC
jgi:HTH-type transcriptional repressor of NAD biosynthesis genes